MMREIKIIILLLVIPMLAMAQKFNNGVNPGHGR